jgi:hypothetical protein
VALIGLTASIIVLQRVLASCCCASAAGKPRGIIRVPLVVQLNLSVPAKTVPEFIAYAMEPRLMWPANCLK